MWETSFKNPPKRIPRAGGGFQKLDRKREGEEAKLRVCITETDIYRTLVQFRRTELVKI